MIFVKNSRNANTKIVSIWQVIVPFQCGVYICIFGFIEPRIKRSPTYPNNQQYATPTVYPTAESYPAETTNHSTVHQPVYPTVHQPVYPKKVKFDDAPEPQFGIVTRTRDDRPCDAMATCDLLEKNGLIVQCELPRFR